MFQILNEQVNIGTKLCSYSTKKEDNQLKSEVIDFYGGYLKDGFIIRSYGGIFQLSIERIHNNELHFPDLTNAFSNIRYIP